MQDLIKQLIRWSTYPIIEIGDSKISLFSVISFVVLFTLILLLSRLIRRLSKRWLLAQLGVDEGSQEAIASIIAYVFVALSLITALQATGINLSSLSVIIGGLGIGVGFGLQGITKDFISGLILLLDRSVRVNDFVQLAESEELQNIKGRIQQISLLFTIIDTEDGGGLVIPNSYLVTNPILNWSYGQKQQRLHLPLRIKQGCDLVLLTETVLNVAYMEKKVLADPAPEFVFIGFGEHYWEFELYAWISDLDQDEQALSELFFGIEYHLRQQGISLYVPAPLLPFSKNTSGMTSAVAEVERSLTPTQEKPLSVRDMLLEVDYFENFTEIEIRQLIENGFRKRIDTGKVLFNEGDKGDAFYIILSGAVEVFSAKLNRTLTTLKAGAFFGELSLILGIPRTASVSATMPTVLFGIDHDGFQNLLQDQEELAEVIVKALGEHKEELAQRQKQLRELGLVEAEEDDENLGNWVRKRLSRLFGLEEEPAVTLPIPSTASPTTTPTAKRDQVAKSS